MTREAFNCLGCITTRTTSPDHYCAHCCHIYAAARKTSPNNVALRGGEWVRSYAGVQTWTGERASDDIDVTAMDNECGTDLGYREHTRKRREKACKDCLSAHSVAERLRAADRRIAKLRALAEQETERSAA